MLCEPEAPNAGADLLRQLGASIEDPLLGSNPNARCVEQGVTPLGDPAVYRGQMEFFVRWAAGLSRRLDSLTASRERLLEQIRGRLGGSSSVLSGPIRIDDGGIETTPLPRTSRIARLGYRVRRLIGR